MQCNVKALEHRQLNYMDGLYMMMNDRNTLYSAGKQFERS